MPTARVDEIGQGRVWTGATARKLGLVAHMGGLDVAVAEAARRAGLDPAKAIAEKQRENNGHIDRKLSFPPEDLYPDGQPAGPVGQETYGAGAPQQESRRGRKK